MAGEASFVFCVHPGVDDVAHRVTHLAVRHLLHEALGPRVNLVSLAPGGDALGRAGLTTRTLYDIGLVAHGLVICGETPDLEVDLLALERLDVPLLLCGLVAHGNFLERWGPGVQGALVERAEACLAAEPRALELLKLVAGPQVFCSLGGHPAIYADRVAEAYPGEAARAPRGGALLVIRDPATMTALTDARRQTMRDHVRDLTRALRARHKDVRLLCQSPAELRFAAAFGDLQLVYAEDPYAWLGAVRAADLVVSWRVEAALVRAAGGAPFIHIGAEGWTRRALRDLGLERWTLDLRDDDLDPAPAALELIHDLAHQADDRIAAFDRWADLDRATSTVFTTFARAVRRARDDDGHRRPVGLPGLEPDESLAPEPTYVDLSVVDTTMLDDE